MAGSKENIKVRAIEEFHSTFQSLFIQNNNVVSFVFWGWAGFGLLFFLSEGGWLRTGFQY